MADAKYSIDNQLWQAAGMRRRQHARRSNVSLGVCAVDLSGPHEPTPRPGRHIQKHPATYFLVLTLRLDTTAQQVDMATQTEEDVQPAPCPLPQPESRGLIYASLLGSKAEAPEAIKVLLAQIRDDHASLPHTLFFRLHSDRGGEFVKDDLNTIVQITPYIRLPPEDTTPTPTPRPRQP